jgi:hypothetical protein
MEPSWLALFEATAKLVAATGLFAYLLHLGGLRPMAIALVTMAHVMFLCCLCPILASFHIHAVLVLGTCTYAVLVVARSILRASIVIACHVGLILPILRESSAGALVMATALAFWTGLMVIIRDWARKPPAEHRQPA